MSGVFSPPLIFDVSGVSFADQARVDEMTAGDVPTDRACSRSSSSLAHLSLSWASSLSIDTISVESLFDRLLESGSRNLTLPGAPSALIFEELVSLADMLPLRDFPIRNYGIYFSRLNPEESDASRSPNERVAEEVRAFFVLFQKKQQQMMMKQKKGPITNHQSSSAERSKMENEKSIVEE